MATSFTTRSLALAMLLASSQPVWSRDDCDAPVDAWQSRSAVNAWAERNGWHVERLKIDDGCYEIKGRDADGRFKATVDPASLQVVRMKRDDGRERTRERERDRDTRRESGASSSPAAASPAGALGPAAPSRRD